MNIVGTVAAFIVALGILVTVHEFGHFWVARRCGVKVIRFSIGFGKAIWRRTDKKGTEYVIAMIPLGGYVKMLDERVEEVEPQHRNQAFNNKTVCQRAAIIAAGPLANFIFAVFAYWLVFIMGVPSVRPVIGDIEPQSIAAQANISPGMELKSVAGIETPDWDSVRLALIGQIGEKQMEVTVAPFGTSLIQTKTLNTTDWKFDPEKQDPIRTLGFIPKLPQIEPVLDVVQPNSAAEKAGLQAGDRLLTVSGKPFGQWIDFVKLVTNSPNIPIELVIERGGVNHSLVLTPEVKSSGGEQKGFAGISPRVIPLPDEYKITRQYNVFTAIYQAGDKTWQLTVLTVKMLGKLVTGEVQLKNLSGPISIAQGAGVSAGYGLVYYLMFLALISVNLGIINLFPLPVLDGGHLVFLAIEKITGKPVSERVQDYSYRVGAILLVLLMGLALFNDFSRFYG
ncbi:sigma E protease regulator RseP [Pragia fontium]|uniref:Zinc metalloprotease n=2 Tax=Pragia fontium TaxID=82985 RepID=A0AAJ4WA58_9GAMM|nr:sigma E protease regulator RseP [Pragia fontium]AKJ43041.1 zinc metallopeptidase RseP [Pragia fontium]SFC69540.1 regulator of sigma E protease [Pragia fontium DSM 5563 = ATCC 49100]SUB83472.1 Regulator of sigma E protease [Pragia fontium]VEJ56377.1 Regulator of sigma E protease [Pragia fontium]GKX63588.1 zinc metalloprotease [Pragia fontium]